MRVFAYCASSQRLARANFEAAEQAITLRPQDPLADKQHDK